MIIVGGNEMYDIGIIGGGPAGMTAAIVAAQNNPNLKICLIEKNNCLGKKLYATGNGKCNLSNVSCNDTTTIMKFFDSIGIVTRTDDAGRLYPCSEQASDVVMALENALHALNIEILANQTPVKIEETTKGFEIVLKQNVLLCKKIMLAIGGKAGPQFGTQGDGYLMAKGFGHDITRTYPVLSPIECAGNFKNLKGVRAKGIVGLEKSGRLIAQEQGEIQFTDNGLSGICVFNLSRFIILDAHVPYGEGIKEYYMTVDFLPNFEEAQLMELLQKRSIQPLGKNADLLLTLVHSSLGLDILEKCNLPENGSSIKLSLEHCQQIAHFLKNWRAPVVGVKGWKNAQVTGGGVELAQVNPDTMESRLVSGLYFAGELLDYDGPSGGYNLHFAWESGIKAGKAMANV
jgi:predicted Rossmann fold flavoprotein